jgi:predicted nucleic acid-binding Zn ribbon protein
MTGPRSLRALLGDWRPRQGGASTSADLAASAFALAWDQAVGPQVAQRSRPTKFYNGVLTVLTASSAWSDELSSLAPRIITSLQRAFPQERLCKLRFLVASGRTKVLLDAERYRSRGGDRRHQVAPPKRHDYRQTDTSVDEDLSATLARLAKAQRRFDEERDRAGWRICSVCHRRFFPEASQGKRCAPCAENLRTASEAKIERALMQAPWLSHAGLTNAVPGVSAKAYERARQRLLARWQFELDAAQRRLRRGSPSVEDRVVAWSFVMLQSGLAQRDIGRGVATDVLGPHWASALFDNVATPKQEAGRPRREKYR